MPPLIAAGITSVVAMTTGVALSSTVANFLAYLVVTAAMAGIMYILRPRQKAQRFESQIIQSDSPRFRIYGARATWGIVRFLERDGGPVGMSIIVNCDAVEDWIEIEVDGTPMSPVQQSVQDSGGATWQQGTIRGAGGLSGGTMTNKLEVSSATTAGRASVLLRGEFPGLERSGALCKGLSCVHFLAGPAAAKDMALYFPNGYQMRVKVTATFTPVWDPRDGAQIRSDKTTWRVSNNPIIQAADYVTHADGMARPDSRINWDSVTAAANYCDTLVAARYGGSTTTEKWAQCALEYSFDEDHRSVLGRFMAACDGYWYEDTQGRISFGIMQWTDPVFAITDADFSWFRLSDAESLETAINEYHAKYTESSRGYSAVDAPVTSLSALIARDGRHASDLRLDEVTTPSQAYRLMNRQLQRHADRRNVSMRMGPCALGLAWKIKQLGVFTAQISSNIFPELNGPYDVLAVQPENNTLERWSVTLRETSTDIYADPVPPWDPALTLNITGATVPGSPTITVINPAGTDVLKITANAPTDNTWTLFAQYRLSGAGDWIDAANYGALIAQTPELAAGTYEIQACWRAPTGIYGVAHTGTGTVTSSPVPPPPTAFAPSGGAGAISVSVTSPNSPWFTGAKIYIAASGAGFGAATLLGTLTFAANSTATQTFSEAAGTYDLYATSRNAAGSESTPDGPVSITVT